MKKKGQKSESMTIGRIEEEDKAIGYRAGNIRPLTNGDNVRKMQMLRYDWDEQKREMVFWHSKDSVFETDEFEF